MDRTGTCALGMTETDKTDLPAAGHAMNSPFPLVAIAGAVMLVSIIIGSGSVANASSPTDAIRPTPRVVGGIVAPDGSWPSQAALLRSSVSPARNANFCGGTLVDRRWILTAAHCMFWPPGTLREGQLLQPVDLDVAIGIQDLGAITASDRIDVDAISINPGWNPSTDQWDFALLGLGTASDRPTTELLDPGRDDLTAGGQPAEVAGWGCTEQTAGNCVAPRPVRLIEAEVEFVSSTRCSSGTSYGPFFDPSTMICAGNFSTGTPDTCFGDSGGPLIATGSRGERFLAGVTSFGEECALPNYPGVYARVTAARDWILRTIAGQAKPKVSLTARPAKRALRKRATFRFRASLSGSTFRCRLNGKAWRRCPSSMTYRDLRRGRKHTFRVKATRDGVTGPVRKFTWFIKRV